MKYKTHKDRDSDKNATSKRKGMRSKSLKNVSNHKVRTYKLDLQNSDYKKVYDYRWNLL